MYTAKVAVGSENRTNHSTRSEHNLEFLNVKPGGFLRHLLGITKLEKEKESMY
jgi:hypothetical protein